MARNIGILALQGGFDLHARRLAEFGAGYVLVKKPEELGGLDGLIIPGGESSVLLHLTNREFREALSLRIRDGLPLLATCAGLIFIASEVMNPAQESLGVLDITVERNAYGRQVNSFVGRDLKCGPDRSLEEAVFIRAPRIVRTGPHVKVLASHGEDPILVQHRNVVGATFHPELGKGDAVYRFAFPALFER